ncbi:helix-turn-helix domain-containing protein [Pseudomonas chlororaphis]|uniref:helix-turn-helix domain-containing protein n=1 Tax=Pseudomonas chlororaphis TaxID=587753 RepID=UPI001E510789|nr:helix-turn-helix transcriptional regulator [Pseudomonas chlororaphis]MCB2256443.1 helix-turn-helix domain-containing protein [Pseudomonas chlororaphis]
MAASFPPSPLLSTTHLGVALRRWRLLHRVKQEHAAQLFKVAQSTISRWENGVQAMEPPDQARLEQLLAARLHAAADQALARLVNDNPRPVHLVCDLTHRLLACSPARAAQFSVPLGELMGESLWRFCTAEIVRQEAALDDLGWRSLLAPPSLEFVSGANDCAIVPIHQSLCRWTRLTLSDGTAARLVETL